MSEQPPPYGGWQSPGGSQPAPDQPVNPMLPPSSLPSAAVPPPMAPPGAPSGWGAAATSAPGAAYGLPYGAPPGPQWRPPPKPGVVPLRPLGLGELLDGSVQTLRQNPRVMLGLSAAVMAVVGVVSTIFQVVGLPRLFSVLDTPEEQVGASEVAGLVGGGFAGFVLPALLQVLATIVLSGILIVAVSEAVLGRRPSVTQVWSTARPRLLRLLGLSLLTGLLTTVLVGVLIGIGLGLLAVSTEAGVVGLVIGVPAAIVVTILLYVRLAFAAPALLLEGLGVVPALRRSWRLVSGSWWRVFGILLLTGIIATVANGLLQTPFSLVGGVLAGVLAPASGSSAADMAPTLIITTVAGNIGTVIASTVSAPFSAAVTALLYIDLRIRREGLDVALARAAEA
ncbi:MAG TPA: hypothetical protein VF661_02825 [Actinomycetales bacterium]|jgi:hypothetical protein